MKILKIFGAVVGIHVLALILIFANPGCSSTSKPTPAPTDTVSQAPGAPTVTPVSTAGGGADTISPVTPVTTGSETSSAEATSSGVGIRFSPTRPNTPAASAVLASPVENVTPATTYTVKPGDSLSKIGSHFHVTAKEIAAANNIKTTSPLHANQKLIIPSKAPAAKAATTAATMAATASTGKGHANRPSDDEFKYTVKPGESLGAIAHKFGVSVRELGTRNNISDPLKLRAGTELVIPGWKATAGGTRASHTASTPSKKSKSAPAAEATPAPATTAPAATETTAPQQPPPNLLESAPAEAAPANPTPTSTVPVINLDDNSGTPAPKP